MKQGDYTDDKAQCNICNKVMLADIFAEHAVNMHEDDVLEILSDDDIIEALSVYVK